MINLFFKGFYGKLPTSEYDLMKDDIKIGLIQIRHRPSHSKEIPDHMASHIYYEIGPAFQREGYGKEILRLGLIEAKKIGLKEIILTCNEDNLASKKIIEANGGSFVEDAFIPSTGKKLLKYKIVFS